LVRYVRRGVVMGLRAFRASRAISPRSAQHSSKYLAASWAAAPGATPEMFRLLEVRRLETDLC